MCARWPVAGRVQALRDEVEAGELEVGKLRIRVVKRISESCVITGIDAEDVLPGDVILAEGRDVEMLKKHFAGRTRVLQVVGREVGDATRIEKLLD